MEDTQPPLVQLAQPRWRTAAFIVVIFAGAVLGWALFLPGHLAARQGARRKPRVDRPGLTFKHMGGIGSLGCNACGHEEGVLSFIHGFRGAAVAGYQCKRCLRFCDVKLAPDTQPDLHCECGGELSRDEKVLCPKCGSDLVKFVTTLMT